MKKNLKRDESKLKICLDLSEAENIRYLKANISNILFEHQDEIENAYKNHFCISYFYLRKNERLKFNHQEFKSEIEYAQNIDYNSEEIDDFIYYLIEIFHDLLSFFEDYEKFYLSIEIDQIKEKMLKR